MVYSDLHNKCHELALHNFDPKFCVAPTSKPISTVDKPVKTVETYVVDIPKPISLADKVRSIIARVEAKSVNIQGKEKIVQKSEVPNRVVSKAESNVEILSAINYVDGNIKEVIFKFNNYLFKSINGELSDIISVEDKNTISKLFLKINYISIC